MVGRVGVASLSGPMSKQFLLPLPLSLPIHPIMCIPYSQKIWRGIKFGSLAVLGGTAKLKSAKIYTACMYVWQYCSRPPNLNPRIHGLGANRQI